MHLFGCAFLALLMAWGISAQAQSVGPLHLERRIPLALHSPTNAACGELAGKRVYVVQGALFDAAGKHAGAAAYDEAGRLLWQYAYRELDMDYGPGAYIHWLADAQLPDPVVVMSVVPESDDRLGAAHVLRASDGALLQKLPNSTRFGNNNSVLADVTGDGKAEFLYSDLSAMTCYRLPDFAVVWRLDTGVRFCWSLPAVAEVTGDGVAEVVFGSEYNNEDGSSTMMAVNGQGEVVWRSDGHEEDLGSTPVLLADIESDGVPELLKVGLDLEHKRQQDWNHLYVFSRGGSLLKRIPLGHTGIAVGDMDRDGHLEAVGLTNTRDGGSNGARAIRCTDLATGTLDWHIDVSRAYLDCNSPQIAMIKDGQRMAAIVGTGNPAGYARLPDSEPWGDLYVVADGEILQRVELPGWPVNMRRIQAEAGRLMQVLVVVDGTPGFLEVYALPRI